MERAKTLQQASQKVRRPLGGDSQAAPTASQQLHLSEAELKNLEQSLLQLIDKYDGLLMLISENTD